MKKVIIYSVCLLITVNLNAQTYYGFDSTSFSGVPAIVLVPGTGKYAVSFQFGPQTEDLDVSSCGMCLLYNSGTPKLVKAGTQIYPLKPDGIHRDSMIIVKFSRANYNTSIFGQDIQALVNAFMSSSYGAHVDSTKNTDGTYKYIGLFGQERGSDAIVNFCSYQSGVSFGTDPSTTAVKYKKLYVTDVDNPYQFSSLGSVAWGRYNLRNVRYFGKTGDDNQAMHDSVAKYSPAAFQVIKIFSSLSYGQISDSMYSVNAPDSGFNMMRNLVGDPGTPPPPLIPVKPKIFRELAGYSSPEGDISKVTGFFDAFGFIDPANGQTNFIPGHRGDTIFGLPRKQYAGYYPTGVINGINWPGNRGLRIIFDWTGAKDMDDTLHQYNFTQIWGYNALFNAGDTLKFYKLDSVFSLSPENRVIYIARPDSLLKPFLVLVTSANPSGVWASATCNINMRYMMVRATLTNQGSFYTTPDFAELSCYGAALYDTTALVRRADSYTGPLPAPNTYGATIGSNFGQGFDTLQQANIGINRTYGAMNYWDSTRANTTTSSAVFTFDYFSDIGPGIYPFFKRTNRKFWWSIKGVSQYLNSTHNGTALNTDNWNGDPESANYTRDGHFYFNYAAKWGNVAVPSSKTHWSGDGSYPNGQGTIPRVENGNEDNFSTSGLCYFMRSSPDWDSLKAADPNFTMIMSGTTELDTAFIDNLAWFCQIFRTDKKFIWNVVNFHHYPRTVNYLGYAASLDQQVGAHGQSPEGDAGIGMQSLYSQGVKSIYNYINGDTSVKIYNTEYGYGNWGTPAANPTQAGAPWDIGNVPSNATFDSLHMKAVLEGRSNLIFPFTGIQVYNQFFFQNSNNQSTNYPTLFTSYGMVALPAITPPFAATYFFPDWYYNACIYSRMKWYYPISIVGANDTTGICHAVYQKMDSTTGLLTDSIVDVVWKTSQQGASLSNVTVTIGYRKNNSVQTMVPSFTAMSGTTGTKPVSGKTVTFTTLDEQPNFAFGRIGADPGYLIFKYRAVWK